MTGKLFFEKSIITITRLNLGMWDLKHHNKDDLIQKILFYDNNFNIPERNAINLTKCNFGTSGKVGKKQ